MAGDWIRIRNDLSEDPAVVWMARNLPEPLASMPEQFKRNVIVGCLCRVWSWADRHTENGQVPADPDCEKDVTQARFRCNAILYLDEISGLNSFANLLLNVGWLSLNEGVISFPKWDRYMSESAKRRALTAKRIAEHRERSKCNMNLLPEKRREEKRRCIGPSGPLLADCKANLLNSWNAIDGFKKIGKFSNKRTEALRARVKDSFWLENWKAALAKAATLPCLSGDNERNWVAGIDWFLRPDTVLKIMEGFYDNWSSKTQRTFDAIDYSADTKRQAEETF